MNAAEIVEGDPFVSRRKAARCHYSPRSRPLRWGKYIMAFVYDAVDGDIGKKLRAINPDLTFNKSPSMAKGIRTPEGARSNRALGYDYEALTIWKTSGASLREYSRKLLSLSR